MQITSSVGNMRSKVQAAAGDSISSVPGGGGGGGGVWSPRAGALVRVETWLYSSPDWLLPASSSSLSVGMIGLSIVTLRWGDAASDRVGRNLAESNIISWLQQQHWDHHHSLTQCEHSQALHNELESVVDTSVLSIVGWYRAGQCGAGRWHTGGSVDCQLRIGDRSDVSWLVIVNLMPGSWRWGVGVKYFQWQSRGWGLNLN